MLQNIEELLTLSSIPGVGSTRLKALMEKFHTPAEVFRASYRDLLSVPGIDRKTAHNIKSTRDEGFARTQLSRMNRCGGGIITYWDDEYPPLLKNIPDPPAFFFIKGALTVEDSEPLAVVGTRRPSNYGKLVAEKLCTALAGRGITVVSGLARGIDTQAHRAVVEAGGRTIAILGSSIDIIYPFENSSLAERITKNGALISEYPMGTEPEAPYFPRRNRLIAGMSLGTLVVEAEEKSGALITAHMALEQNREVFAIPGNIISRKSYGTNSLIQEGAKLVLSENDIIDELRPHLTLLKKEALQRGPAASYSDLERKLLDALSYDPAHIDSIASSLSLPTSKVLTVLLSLELKNVVRQGVGKMFYKV